MTSYLRRAAKSDLKALCVVRLLSEKKRHTFKVRLDWTRSEGWQPSPVVAYVTREGCQPSQVVANLRDWLLHRLIFRGGVEDTRLEAKDTKKIQGQGQPFRGQTLSRPRTQAQVLSKKKKIFTKIFQAISKKGLHKNFSSDPHEKLFSKEFFKRSTKF